MKRIMPAIALALMVMGSACGRNNSKAADSALSTDLSLAAQQRGFTAPDSLSPAERARVNAAALNGSAVASVPRSTTTHQSTSSGEVARRRSSGGSSGSSVGSSSAPVATSSGHVVKHTQRDAAIGAAAGAVLGATTSRNKVKGGLIGAAVGGILGGVIGNNVDKKKVP
jgi:hypothetical protein